MKKLIYTRVLLVFSISLLLLSCNKEDNNTNSGGNAKVDSFLKSFYHQKVQLGKTLESRMIKPSSSTAKTVEYEDIKLAEVFVGDEERARGYVVTHKDTDEFLYFADVDRQEYKLTTFDVEKNETLIKENINQLQEYAKSNGLDLTLLLEEYQGQVNAGNTEYIGKWRFWGWTGWTPVGDCNNGFQTIVNTHYIFGVRDQIEHNVVACP